MRASARPPLLLVTPGFPSPEAPARMRFTLEQALALRTAGLEVTVVDDAAGDRDGWDDVDGLPVLRLPHLGSFREHPGDAVARLRARRRAVEPLRAQAFAGVLVSFADHKHWSVLAGGGFRGARRGVVVHGVDVMKPEPCSPRTIGTRALLRSADAVFAVSRYTSDLARAWLAGAHRDKVRLAHNGVDLEKLREARQLSPAEAKARLGWPSQPLILTVCNLVPRKDVGSVLRAVALLRRRGHKVRYVVVGHGPEREALEAESRALGLAGVVRFESGNLSERDLALRFAACDIFAMLSRTVEEPPGTEGFGLVYAEAQAVGRAVVAGRSGGVPEVVADGVSGLLVSVETSGVEVRAAEALERLLVDRNYRDLLGSTGRARVEARFDWGRQARIIISGLRLTSGPTDELDDP